jgi:hypothetical protein
MLHGILSDRGNRQVSDLSPDEVVPKLSHSGAENEGADVQAAQLSSLEL